MNDETKLKIVVLGPISSGKSSISNFLSDATENVTGEYRPTKGVRILEYSAEGLGPEHKSFSKTEIELWDCSGDLKYESCWPAILHKTDGILFVYGADSSQRKKDLEHFYQYFVEKSGFSEKNCILMLNRQGTDHEKEKLASVLPNLKRILVDIEEKGAELRKHFNYFLSDIIRSNADDAIN